MSNFDPQVKVNLIKWNWQDEIDKMKLIKWNWESEIEIDKMKLKNEIDKTKLKWNW